jgi:pimeloyl-ACP methyl ester carboxylesterase
MVILTMNARPHIKRLSVTIALFVTVKVFAQDVSDICVDPPKDESNPPAMIEVAVPSHGSQLLGVFYRTGGAGVHPTVIFLHGFPGYEQNLDLAQALRRDGYNVLAVHYRGSWGVTGTFSFTHAIEDADAQARWLALPQIAARYHVDLTRVILMGHSAGGFIALSATTHNPNVSATVLISATPLTHRFANFKPEERDKAIAVFVKTVNPANLLPLARVTPATLGAEIFDHRKDWDFITFAPAVGKRPILLITADDGSGSDSEALLQFLKQTGNTQSIHIEFATDHSFSDHRIALEKTIIQWLDQQKFQTPVR